jgi:hypothetical protein
LNHSTKRLSRENEHLHYRNSFSILIIITGKNVSSFFLRSSQQTNQQKQQRQLHSRAAAHDSFSLSTTFFTTIATTLFADANRAIVFAQDYSSFPASKHLWRPLTRPARDSNQLLTDLQQEERNTSNLRVHLAQNNNAFQSVKTISPTNDLPASSVQRSNKNEQTENRSTLSSSSSSNIHVRKTRRRLPKRLAAAKLQTLCLALHSVRNGIVSVAPSPQHTRISNNTDTDEGPQSKKKTSNKAQQSQTRCMPAQRNSLCV